MRSFFISVMLVCVAVFGAHADPYRMWASEVSKATKGLSICREAYSNAVGVSSGGSHDFLYAFGSIDFNYLDSSSLMWYDVVRSGGNALIFS